MKKIIAPIIGTLAIMVLVVAGTYAWWTWNSSAAENTTVSFSVNGTTIDMVCTVTGDPKLVPIANETYTTGGLKSACVLTLTGGTTYVNFTLTPKELPTELKQASFKYWFGTSSLIKTGNFSTAVVNTPIALNNEPLVVSNTTTYNLYLWIDGTNFTNPLTMQNKTYRFHIKANGSDSLDGLA